VRGYKIEDMREKEPKMSLQTEYRNRTNNQGHFFDPAAMKFFRSRIGAVRIKHEVWYFITSEKPPHGDRAYSVRKMGLDGNIKTVRSRFGEFCSMTSYQANKLLIKSLRAKQKPYLGAYGRKRKEMRMREQEQKQGFLPSTIEGWCKKKRLFVRLWSKEGNVEQKEVYEEAINYCDRKVGQTAKVARRLLFLVIVVNVLVVLSIFAQGCGTIAGLQSDLHQITRPTTLERGQ
jgi:hypothetical protein